MLNPILEHPLFWFGCHRKKCIDATPFYVLTFQENTPWSFWYIIHVHITLGSRAMGAQSQMMSKFHKYENLWGAKLSDFKHFSDWSYGTPWHFVGLFSLQTQWMYPQIYWVENVQLLHHTSSIFRGYAQGAPPWQARMRLHAAADRVT